MKSGHLDGRSRRANLPGRLGGKRGLLPMPFSEQQKKRLSKLAAIHQRVQWMADEEARSAWVGDLAARAIFLDEKERLIAEAERILDELEQKSNANPP